MRRRLTSREIVLIVILVVLVLVSGYYLLFYVPVQNEKDSITNRIEDTETEIMLSDAGFVYCLGEVEDSVGDFLQKFYAERAIFS